MSTETSEDLLGHHQELAKRLRLLADSPELDAGQRALARAWWNRLDRAAQRARAPLSIAFFAQIGLGKSSLIAAATDLRLSKEGSPRKWSVLPVGDGRTTLGETRIEFNLGDRITLEVESISEDDLRMEVRLFAEDLWRRNTGRTATAPSGDQAGEELHRLLRAWFVPDQSDRYGPLNAFARSSNDVDALEQGLLSKIDIKQRTTRFERQFSAARAGLSELRDTLHALMRGELASAPAPQQVRLSIPRGTLAEAVDSIIDTSGVDAMVWGISIRARPDLHDLISDPDVLPVICSEFTTAPDSVAIEFGASIANTGTLDLRDRPWRMVIVDARELDDDPAEHERAERERSERVEECRDRLRREALSHVEERVVAIDARREAVALRTTLEQLIADERRRRMELYESAYRNALDASNSLRDVDFSARARLLDLRLWWAWDAVLADSSSELINGLATLSEFIERWSSIQHWSPHLYATSRRRGRYSELRLDLLGAQEAAKRQIKLHKVLGRINDLRKEQSHLPPALNQHFNNQFIAFHNAAIATHDDTRRRWQELLASYFDSPSSNDLWAWCVARWGQGPGYVQDVAERFRREAEHTTLTIPKHSLSEISTKDLPPRPPLFSLRAIELRNFRGLDHRSIPITDATTVLVGDNGLGKTAWLEAIAVTVGVLLPGIGAGPAPKLRKGDVREVIRKVGKILDRQPQLPTTLRVEATIQGRMLEWSLRKERSDDDAVVIDDDGLQLFADQMGEEIRDHSDRQLPVLAYYGTQRLWPDIVPTGERDDVSTRLDGYRDCLEAASSHELMQKRVRRYTQVELQRQAPIPLLRAIARAVVDCVEEADAFHYDLELEDFVLTLKDGSLQPFRTLSDGYRNIVAMVADIAWRASALNPQLGDRAPLLAEGVVLIDELDLHLHPRWQRRVLADLRRAFPRLQFIATTHSPFIIQSLQPGQLVNLDPDAEPDAPYANESPEDITEKIMGVEIPQRSERRRREYDVAKRYYDLLERVPQADEAELARLKNELDELLAPYSDNQAFVAFLELKRAAAEAKRG